ncbi:MAG: hypothetical protein LBN95_00800 [Prevotellaceae bacterium]|jgi:acyl-ACP thioesterase|nr:hypothetical protein [Prevotellaceae bacterium]
MTNTFKYFVTPQDVDFSWHITISALGNYILNTAGLAATLNNFGMERLQEENLAWVVSRFAVEMQQLPTQHEEFTVETWVEDYNRLFTTRNFKIFDKNHNPIGNATSIWAIIDTNTRRTYSLDNKIEWKRFATGVPSEMEKPVRVAEIAADKPATTYHSVVYSDIDFNEHVNTMKYFQWSLDTFDLEQFKNQQFKRFDANFMHEARFGENVAVFREDFPQKNIFEVRNSENKPLAKIQLTWEKK